MVRRLSLVIMLLLAGCAQPDSRPTEVQTWGTWDESGSTLTVNLRALDEPFSATRCDCVIEISVDDRLLGTWQARPADFQATNGRDRMWSMDVPRDQVPDCTSAYDFELNLAAALRLPDGTTLQDSRMLACKP